MLGQQELECDSKTSTVLALGPVGGAARSEKQKAPRSPAGPCSLLASGRPGGVRRLLAALLGAGRLLLLPALAAAGGTALLAAAPAGLRSTRAGCGLLGRRLLALALALGLGLLALVLGGLFVVASLAAAALGALGLCRFLRVGGLGPLAPVLGPLLLGLHQLEDRDLAGVAQAAALADDPRVAAGTLGVPGGDRVEQLLGRILVEQVRVDVAPRGQVAALGEGDHALRHAARLLGLRHRGLDPLVQEERGDQVAKERAPVLVRARQLSE